MIPPAASSDFGSTANPWFWLVISDPPGVQVLHRLVAAAVPELQLERRRPDGPPEKLMAQADAEDRRTLPIAPSIGRTA